jgi:hypothetical protein
MSVRANSSTAEEAFVTNDKAAGNKRSSRWRFRTTVGQGEGKGIQCRMRCLMICVAGICILQMMLSYVGRTVFTSLEACK